MYKIYIHTAPNGKKYVGQTCQRLERRWRNGGGYVRNAYFYRAIQKYGWENFKHEVVLLCADLKEANEKEKQLIAELKTNDPKFGYNISGGADGREKVAESTRRLMSEQRKGKFAGANNPYYGKKHTEKERKIMSEKSKGRFVGDKSPLYGKHPSDETRAKMSKSRKESALVQEHMQKMNKAKAKPVLCVETKIIYESARQAARETGLGQGNISAACRGLFKQAYGYHWVYV